MIGKTFEILSYVYLENDIGSLLAWMFSIMVIAWAVHTIVDHLDA